MVIFIAIVHVVVIFAIAFQLYRGETRHRVWFWPALAIKLIAGVCLGLIYIYYYSAGDTFTYFYEASKAAGIAREDFPSYLSFLFSNDAPGHPFVMTDSRALFFTRITSLFSLLTGDNYWAIGFYFSFFSFLGAWFLVKVISRNIPSVSSAAVVAFLFLPSAVFWTSGVLKESVAIAALYMLTALFLKVWFRESFRWWQMLLAPVLLWLLWNLKYYYAGVFLAVAGATLVYRWWFGQRHVAFAGREALTWVLTLIAPAILVTFLHPNFNMDRLLTVVVENNAAYNALSAPGDAVNFYALEATPLSMLMNAPWALVSGLFRPFPWEASSVVQVAAGLENIVLLLLFLTCLFRAGQYVRSPHRLLMLAAMAYVFVLAVFLTLSAPNFGTLSRYRCGYIPLFAFIMLCNVLQYVERSCRRLVNQ